MRAIRISDALKLTIAADRVVADDTVEESSRTGRLSDAVRRA